MTSVAPRPGSVKGGVAPYRPEPEPSIPFPTWHALCAEMLARHREMGLNYGECCLFAILVHYSTPDSNKLRFSHATNETLAEKMGCEVRDVQRFLKTLEKGGFIERWKRTDRGKTRELERSRDCILILWEPGDDRSPALLVRYPWAPGHAEAKAKQEAWLRHWDDTGANAPNVNSDVGEHAATSNSTLGNVNSDHGCNVKSDTPQRQVCRTYEIPPEIPLEEKFLREPASPSSPASAGPNPKTPPGTDAHGDGKPPEGIGIPSGWNVMLPPKAAGELLRGITAKVERERAPAVKITHEQNAAGIEWLGRWRKWRDGGKEGPIPAWTSSEPMLPGVRQKFDEYERASRIAE